jgi:hypothetical protein
MSRMLTAGEQRESVAAHHHRKRACRFHLVFVTSSEKFCLMGLDGATAPWGYAWAYRDAFSWAVPSPVVPFINNAHPPRAGGAWPRRGRIAR